MSEIKKVTIPAEVAEAIESLRNDYGYSVKELIADVVIPEYQVGPSGKVIRDYGSNNFNTYLSAITNGYEIEQPPKKITLELTPEELGTVVSRMAVASFSEADSSARRRGITVAGGRNSSGESTQVYLRLSDALAEASA